MSYILQQYLDKIKDYIEESSYGSIDSYALERLKEKCMGDDLYRVQFHYSIEWVGRECAFYVDTHHYGYWRLEESGEWVRIDIDEEGDAA